MHLLTLSKSHVASKMETACRAVSQPEPTCSGAPRVSPQWPGVSHGTGARLGVVLMHEPGVAEVAENPIEATGSARLSKSSWAKNP